MKMFLSLLLLLTHNAFATTKIAIVDSGLNLKDSRFTHLCSTGHKDTTNTGIDDVYGHGTHVTGIIQTYAGDKDYCYIIIKYFSVKDSVQQSLKHYLEALHWAIKQHVDVINLSVSGSTYNKIEDNIIKTHPNIKFIIAAGNDSVNLDDETNNIYPASYTYKNVIVVGNVDRDGHISSTSNYGYKVKKWEIGLQYSTVPGGYYDWMNGTSMSAAVATGKYIKYGNVYLSQ